MRTPSLTFKAGGTLKEANFYIERSADDELPAALLPGRVLLRARSAPDGKSSLRYRVSRLLSDQHDVRCATVDLTGLGTGTAQAEDWYFGIVDDIARQLGDESLRIAAEDFWVTNARLPVVQRFTRFLREVLLLQTTGRLVVFVDEIDAVRALPSAVTTSLRRYARSIMPVPDDPVRAPEHLPSWCRAAGGFDSQRTDYPVQHRHPHQGLADFGDHSSRRWKVVCLRPARTLRGCSMQSSTGLAAIHIWCRASALRWCLLPTVPSKFF